jgi:Fasciclin domain
VFAPTNEAFAELPAGTVDNLLKPENKKTLVKILTTVAALTASFVARRDHSRAYPA